MAESLRWGLLGTARIGKAFAAGVAHSETGRVVAVGSRSRASADAYAADLGGLRAHGSYEALLADPEVDAVYVATPHPMHARWAIAAAQAGKHVLCEKPLALNHAEAMGVVEAARANDVFLMEAFMYRCHPQTAKLVELLRDGAVGDVRVIRATFAFDAGFDPEKRLFANALGGGGILDVGGYATSGARLVAGVALGGTVAEPVEVQGTARLGETGVDEWALGTLRFPDDILAQVATGVRCGMDNQLVVFGSEGRLTVPSPWVPAKEGGTVEIYLARKGKEPETLRVETNTWLYGLEADTVARQLADRQAAFPAMTWDDTLGNMKTLDRWRQAIGLEYESERVEADHPTVHGRPLRVRDDAPMTYGAVPNLRKRVSRLVMGVDNQDTMPHCAVLFDDFFERGGNCWDCAYIYGGGRRERLLGRWVEERGIRDEVVLLDKGAHTPHCTPEALTRQFLESLDRLRTDYVDIYVMHRDNPEVPVGEFVDAMNAQFQAGRMRVFGGSNWSRERLEAANACAADRALEPMRIVSNNFSLARMVDPVWAGCIASSTPEWRRWLAEHDLVLMPWSSQARGFFVRADPADTSDPELVRCWYAEDNFRRKARAEELAAKRGVPPIAIALAYVLAQPFMTFPLIGPRTVEETRTSMLALGVDLAPDEVAWLNLED